MTRHAENAVIITVCAACVLTLGTLSDGMTTWPGLHLGVMLVNGAMLAVWLCSVARVAYEFLRNWKIGP